MISSFVIMAAFLLVLLSAVFFIKWSLQSLWRRIVLCAISVGIMAIVVFYMIQPHNSPADNLYGEQVCLPACSLTDFKTNTADIADTYLSDLNLDVYVNVVSFPKNYLIPCYFSAKKMERSGKVFTANFEKRITRRSLCNQVAFLQLPPVKVVRSDEGIKFIADVPGEALGFAGQHYYYHFPDDNACMPTDAVKWIRLFGGDTNPNQLYDFIFFSFVPKGGQPGKTSLENAIAADMSAFRSLFVMKMYSFIIGNGSFIVHKSGSIPGYWLVIVFILCFYLLFTSLRGRMRPGWELPVLLLCITIACLLFYIKTQNAGVSLLSSITEGKRVSTMRALTEIDDLSGKVFDPQKRDKLLALYRKEPDRFPPIIRERMQVLDWQVNLGTGVVLPPYLSSHIFSDYSPKAEKALEWIKDSKFRDYNCRANIFAGVFPLYFDSMEEAEGMASVTTILPLLIKKKRESHYKAKRHIIVYCENDKYYWYNTRYDILLPAGIEPISVKVDSGCPLFDGVYNGVDSPVIILTFGISDYYARKIYNVKKRYELRFTYRHFDGLTPESQEAASVYKKLSALSCRPGIAPVVFENSTGEDKGIFEQEEYTRELAGFLRYLSPPEK